MKKSSETRFPKAKNLRDSQNSDTKNIGGTAKADRSDKRKKEK